MPRTADRKEKGFIWLPREEDVSWDLKIDSVSVKSTVVDASFTRAIAPEIGSFEVSLENSNQEYSGKYSGGETVEFFIDLSDGTTKRFEGTIDTIKNKFSDSEGFLLKIAGGHISSELLYIPITKEYGGDKTTDEILVDLIGELTGYTSNNVNADTTRPTIKWNAKPFWDCVTDLTKLSGFDCYVDDNKDFHYFKESSVENNDEAIVWNDTLIEAPDIGKQTLTERTKITVIGDDGTGLPIISTTGTGKKQEVIFDSNVSSNTQASELSNTEYSLKSAVGENTEGRVLCFALPSISPGEKIWFSNPKMKITKQIKVYKYKHKFPLKHTECFSEAQRETPHIFKKRVEKELASQTITNPFNMTNSINSKFDDTSELSSRDSNVEVAEGKIRLSSGTQGVFTSLTHSIPAGISEVHLRTVSDNLNADFELSTDGGTKFEAITPESRKVIDYPVSADAQVVLKVTIQSATCEIDSIFLGYK